MLAPPLLAWEAHPDCRPAPIGTPCDVDGTAAVEATQNVYADLCFIGVTGDTPGGGAFTARDAQDAAMKRALAARAAEAYTLASPEKIGTASPYRVLPWRHITGMDTDVDPTREVVEQVSALDVELVHAAGANS